METTETQTAKTLHICKNCENEFSGNYCNECGQHLEGDEPPSVSGILLYHFYHFLHNFRDFMFTSWHLLLRPGTVLLEYRAGKHKKYYNPLNYFLVVGSAFLFLSVNFPHGSVETATKNQMKMYGQKPYEELSPEAYQALDEEAKKEYDSQKRTFEGQVKYLEWAQRHFNLVMLITAPFFALGIYLSFRKYGYTYGEQLLFTFHLYGFSTLISLPTIPFANPMDLSQPIKFFTLPAFVLYFAWAFRDLHKISLIKGIWKTLLSYFLYMLIFMVMVFVLTFIAVIIYTVFFKKIA
ncbi:MAG: DUF3667 domain-containing protein [Bacteroidia bacterium]|nr:DUF3667 domain-containing protein [Bacteroidia bacterium]